MLSKKPPDFTLVSCLTYSKIQLQEGLHDLISQKIELFTTTAVKTSSPREFVYRVFQKELCNGVERWIVCTPLSVNVFVTLATQ
jgi:hypothetical protein